MVRGWVHQGLFTADDDEEIWGIAHRILLPAFSNQGMKQYFHVVQECIEQLFVKWDGVAEGNQAVDLNKSTVLFTFDVIGRVGFGHNFKAQETGTHPYLEQLQKASDFSDARWEQGFLRSVRTSAGVERLKNVFGGCFSPLIFVLNVSLKTFSSNICAHIFFFSPPFFPFLTGADHRQIPKRMVRI